MASSALSSNRLPEKLYERGLNRKYFLPFVDLLNERADIRRVGGTGDDVLDYRALGSPRASQSASSLPKASLRALAPRRRGVFLQGHDAEARLNTYWIELENALEQDGSKHYPVGSGVGSLPSELPVAFGRRLALHRRAGNACWLSFHELCGRPSGARALGATDYLALASAADVLFMSGVPKLDKTQRNEARRFVALIDALYEARVQLFLTAAAPLDSLFAGLLNSDSAEIVGGAEVDVSAVPDAPPDVPSFHEAPVGGHYQVDGELANFFTAKDEQFMLRRTTSRLVEMCSPRDEHASR